MKLEKCVIAALLFMASIPVFAQEESGEDQLSNGFKKFSVEEAFEDNGFQWFRDAQLLCAGNKEKSNAMTIGWGGIGTLWRKTALTVYVAEKRYTKEFLDNSEYFTVMSFDVKDSKGRSSESHQARLDGRVVTELDAVKVLNYMGTKSGRDGDRSATSGDACPDKKAQALGLHTAFTANGTPYYTEATMVIECKIMYAAPFDPQGFKSDAPKQMYANFPAGIHSMYIGEVVNAWKK